MSKSEETLEPVVLAVVGSRRLRDTQKFNAIVDKWVEKHGKPDLIVTGCAAGVDALARQYARSQGIPCEEKKALWKSLHGAAGPIRNTQIVAACTHMLAMPDKASKGTWDSYNKAKSAGKHVTLENLD